MGFLFSHILEHYTQGDVLYFYILFLSFLSLSFLVYLSVFWLNAMVVVFRCLVSWSNSLSSFLLLQSILLFFLYFLVFINFFLLSHCVFCRTIYRCKTSLDPTAQVGGPGRSRSRGRNCNFSFFLLNNLSLYFSIFRLGFLGNRKGRFSRENPSLKLLLIHLDHSLIL